MPNGEGEAQEQGKEKEESKKREPLFSKLGLLIFLVVMVIWTGVLFFLFGGVQKNLKKFTEEEKQKTEELINKIALQAENAPEVKIEDITQFVRTNVSGTQGRMLACTLVLKLGLTKEEQEKARRDNFQLPKDFDLNKKLKLDDKENSYLAILEKMKGKLKYLVIKEINQYDFQQLSTAEVKEKIANKIKDIANEKLKRLGLEPRVADAYWTDFTFSGD